MLAAIPGAVAVGKSVVKAGESLFAKKGGADYFKDKVWAKIPFSLRRITGGKGKWRDTLTGETGNDQWSDVRAVAIVAGAINTYVDRNGVLYDNDSGASLSREEAWARWRAAYGDWDFQTAYAKDPTAFVIFGNDPSLDPKIGFATPKQPNAAQQVVDYAKEQGQSVVDAAKLAAANLTGVATGAASGAAAGAQATIATQKATQSNTLLYILLGATALVAIIVITSKKRG